MPLPDPSSCHHCHIHAPIPARDLKRTHPLRSHFVENHGAEPEPLSAEQSHNSFRKNVSFLYRKISRRNATSAAQKKQSDVSLAIPPPPPLPPRMVDDRPAVVIDSLPSPAFQPLKPASVDGRDRHRRRGLAGLQAVLLVGAYALLLVLAVVIGVVLSQGGRRPVNQPRLLGPGRPMPPRNVFQDSPIRVSRPRLAPSPPRAAPRPRPASPPRPPPSVSPSIKDLDFEYYDDHELTVLPNPVSSPPRAIPSPAPAPFRPAPAPREPTPVLQPVGDRRSSAPPARRTQTTVPLAKVDSDFKLQGNAPVRGRKEPKVKILRSWSHHNADGTFSWGYYNADGSFKNETRGLDCVVRGVYGYVVKETGEQLSFPYESGNPCDPDAPDYYYDYETDTAVFSEGAEPRSPLGISGSLPRRQG